MLRRVREQVCPQIVLERQRQNMKNVATPRDYMHGEKQLKEKEAE
jgi:hypothetical protein